MQPENCIKRGIQDGKKSNRETSNINCSNRFEVLSTTDADDDDENTSQSSKSGNATTSEFVGNTAKGRNSKRVFQENKARQIFRKTSIFYTLCVSGGKKCSFVRKFDVLCFLETPVLRFVFLITDEFMMINDLVKNGKKNRKNYETAHRKNHEKT